MKKMSKKTIALSIGIVCVAVAMIYCLVVPDIERHTWVLSNAVRSDLPGIVVAHGGSINTDDPMFQVSQPIELICEAKNGKLILTDRTNGKTYEGSYEYGRHGRRLKHRSYVVVIEGTEGRANISTGDGRALFVSIGGYYLNFFAE